MSFHAAPSRPLRAAASWLPALAVWIWASAPTVVRAQQPPSQPAPSSPVRVEAAQPATVRASEAALAPANDTLYGALILATNDPADPTELPPTLRPLAQQLGAFGYTHFRLLGEKTKAVPTGTEDWLVPSRQFYLRVDTKSRLPDGSGYRLGLQLLQHDRLLREVDYTLRREHPLFIRGPMLGAGQLVVLLAVM